MSQGGRIVVLYEEQFRELRDYEERWETRTTQPSGKRKALTATVPRFDKAPEVVGQPCRWATLSGNCCAPVPEKKDLANAMPHSAIHTLMPNAALTSPSE